MALPRRLPLHLLPHLLLLLERALLHLLLLQGALLHLLLLLHGVRPLHLLLLPSASPFLLLLALELQLALLLLLLERLSAVLLLLALQLLLALLVLLLLERLGAVLLLLLQQLLVLLLLERLGAVLLLLLQQLLVLLLLERLGAVLLLLLQQLLVLLLLERLGAVLLLLFLQELLALQFFRCAAACGRRLAGRRAGAFLRRQRTRRLWRVLLCGRGWSDQRLFARLQVRLLPRRDDRRMRARRTAEARDDAGRRPHLAFGGVCRQGPAVRPDRPAGRLGRHRRLEVRGARSRGDRGLALVGRDELLRSNAGCLDLLALHRRRRNARLRGDALFLRGWGRDDAAGAAAVADVGDVGDVVNDDRVVVDGRDLRRADVVHCGIVEEPVPVPPSAVIAVAEIAEAVIDAAIEADLMGPIAGMEGIDAAGEDP